MNQKIIIGVIAVVLIAGGIYFVTSRNSDQSSTQPIENANWKTYRNEQYSFSVKIPQDYKAGTLVQGAGGGQGRQVGIIFNSDPYDPKKPRVKIFLPTINDVTYNPNAKSLTDYEKSYTRTYKTGNSNTLLVTIESNEEVRINGILALKQVTSVSPQDFMGAPVSHAVRYVFYKNGNFIILHSTDGTAADNKLLDDIAKTFEFTK